MNYTLYVGGVTHAFSPIGACQFDPEIMDEFNSLPALPLLPLFDNDEDIDALYSNEQFSFTSDRFHVFSIVCSQKDKEASLGTTLLVALVPTNLTRNTAADVSKFNGKLTAFGVERFATLYNTKIHIINSATTNKQFVKNALLAVSKKAKKISTVLCKRKVMFDIAVIDKTSAKPVKNCECKEGVKLIYNHENETRELLTEKNILGVGHFLKNNLALKCDEDSVRNLGTLPTFYLEKHPILSSFSEMIWGVDKPHAEQVRSDN